MFTVRSGAIEREPGFGGPVTAARFDPQDKLAVEEFFTPFVQQQRINPVAKGVIHTRGDKHVFITVGIEVADAQAPRPVIFHPDLIRDLDKSSLFRLAIEGVAVDTAPLAQEEILAVLHIGFQFLLLRPDGLAHIRVHIGKDHVHATVVISVKDLDPHRAPRRARKDLAAFVAEVFALHIFVVVVMPLHIQHIEVEPTIFVGVQGTRITGPTAILQPALRRYVDKTIIARIFK